MQLLILVKKYIFDKAVEGACNQLHQILFLFKHPQQVARQQEY